MDRVIFHVDMNNYFASVEELHSPHLRDVPMAICGSPESRRGIITAKNQKAKALGIVTAETVYSALRKCPGLVLRPPRRHEYEAFYNKANAIYLQYTDLVEPASIDESYLDVTGTLHMFGEDGKGLADEIRERIHRELGLTVSVGVSYNKFFAKMASEIKKPNATTVLSRENYREVLWALPIGQMHGVGKAAEEQLRQMNILTIGALAQYQPSLLEKKLGKQGAYLHRCANGLDASVVRSFDAVEEPKSIGNGRTFKRDLLSREDAVTALKALSDSVATRLRRHGLKCMTVQLTIKDPSLRVITRQKGLAAPTWLAADIGATCMELLEANWKAGSPIRLLTVTAQKLVPKEAAVEQTTFFQAERDATREKKEKLEQAVDSLRRRFGNGVITTAAIAKNDLGIHEENGIEEDG